MDKLKLGGIGCVLVLVGVLLRFATDFILGSFDALANTLGDGGAGAALLGVALGGLFLPLMGGILVLLGTLGLHKRFESYKSLYLGLYWGGGILVLVAGLVFLGNPPHVVAILPSGEVLWSPPGEDAMKILAITGSVGWLGWMVLGIALVQTRTAVSRAMGAGRERFVPMVGILLIIPFVHLVGSALLGILFFRLAKTAPVPPVPSHKTGE